MQFDAWVIAALVFAVLTVVAIVLNDCSNSSVNGYGIPACELVRLVWVAPLGLLTGFCLIVALVRSGRK